MPSGFVRTGVVCAAIAAAWLGPREARADVSSWAYVGAGPASLRSQNSEQRWVTALDIQVGLGTPPTSPVVFGGLFRMTPFFGEGIDLGLSLRGATRGFVTGGFGLAVDAGPYQRFWGEGSTGGHGALVLGAPWGITLSGFGGVGSNETRYFGATLGLDFARLTVYRLSGLNYFPNPKPAYRP